MAINETSNDPAHAAVVAINTTEGDGVWGQCDAGRGVVGVSKSGVGVWGHTTNGRGVVGVVNEDGTGVWGETKTGRGVVGIVKTDGDGTWGECDAGRGVVGVSKTGSGVWGETVSGRAVVGVSATDIGVFGKGGRLAALFEGNVDVTGSMTVQGINVGALSQRVASVEGQVQAAAGLHAIENRVNSLASQLNGLQQQLTNLQQKHESEVAGIANSLITLAQRVTALGG